MRSSSVRVLALLLPLGVLPACGNGTVDGNGNNGGGGEVDLTSAGGEDVDLAGGGGGPDISRCRDNDGDGYGQNCPRGADCDDQNPQIYPGAPDFCDDGLDQNCDGAVDEPGCLCHLGEVKVCYSGPGGTAGVGICRLGQQHCGVDGSFGPCAGEVKPGAEACDGEDNDCDGVVDNGVKNACGGCGSVPAEVCGDGLDNNCDGRLDEGCGTCDPQCLCTNNQCRCSPPRNQPCYSGAPQTAGMGLCRSGLTDCLPAAGGTYVWGPCRGEVIPTAPVCDGQDHDCDGSVDDSNACPCTDGATRSCGSDEGECRRGRQTCAAGRWGACAGGVEAAQEGCDGKDNDCDGLTDEGVVNACGKCGAVPREACGDGLDNDCNGRVDEDTAGCTSCNGQNEQACYRGPADTRRVGACKDGKQFCVRQEIGESWGECSGDTLPAPSETCGNTVDDDCNGAVDDGCACTDGATRRCGSDVGECVRGLETCRNGSYGACDNAVGPVAETCDGKDNDCDGLTDEGVLNACGKCPPMPCFVEGYDTPGNCSEPGRTCNAVGPDPTNPRAITLGETTNQLLPFIYIAVTSKNQVAQLNTETGQKTWQRDSYGIYPSRTAVALDGTVWAGNRCLTGGRDNDYTCSSMVHLDLNGNLICRADVPGWVRGVAIDADGAAWAGAYNGQRAWKVSGTEVDRGQSPPRCRILGSVDVGVNVYGLAVDGRGFLYTASNTNQPTVKVRTSNVQLVDRIANSNSYGIAIDRSNRVWFGNNYPHRLNGDPPYSVLAAQPQWGGTGSGYYAITVHPDGSIWVAGHDTPGIARITLNAGGTAITSVQRFADPEGTQNHGIAVDKAGKLWSPQRFTGYVNRWNTNGVREARFPVDPGNQLYSYSDMTGIQLRTITVREGHWIQHFDTGYAAPSWDHVEWTAMAPAGSSVSVSVRTADAEADFAQGRATQWCGPFAASPGSFAGCAFLNGHRWAEVDIKLGTTTDGVRPSVSDVKVFWSY